VVHGYAGGADMMSRFRTHIPIGDMHWTEGAPTTRALPTPSIGCNGVTRLRRHCATGCQSLTGWNLALDEKGRPNIGPFPCGGLVTIHSQTKRNHAQRTVLGLRAFLAPDSPWRAPLRFSGHCFRTWIMWPARIQTAREFLCSDQRRRDAFSGCCRWAR